MDERTNKDANLSQPKHKLKVEKDVDIPMRDGARLKADVFRPDADGRFPALINIGLYQKDKLWTPPPDLEEKPNPYMSWETVNPMWWVPRGYAAVRVDTRGAGKSPGQTAPFSLQEMTDFYDAIEWAAQQPWCNGRVATMGISYYAQTQWWVANLKPPSLKAIIPWEGRADQYRDASYHGGIFGIGFVTTWFTTHMAHHLLGRAHHDNPDTFQFNYLRFLMGNSLDSGAFRDAQAQWDRIDIPLLAVGNWSGNIGQHLRGATEGFVRAASKHKKLRIHTGTHYHPFYSEDGRRDQLRFLDHWLKDIDTGVMDEPPVKLAIRRGRGEYDWRLENEWPIARTQWTKLYFDLSRPGERENVHGRLVKTNPAKTASAGYVASGATRAGHASSSATSLAGGSLAPMGISLETAPLTDDTEITGPLAAVLWVSSITEDMDVFLTLRKIGPDGKDVFEVGQQGQDVAVTKGWLRASHRELDPALTLPYRPYHKHTRRQYLEPGEIVRLDIEIWPTSMVFQKGHRIRLDIQPRDGICSAPFTHYHADYNTGTNTVYAGGDMESFLLLPVIPPKEE
jgi:uncharacterized protein